MGTAPISATLHRQADSQPQVPWYRGNPEPLLSAETHLPWCQRAAPTPGPRNALPTSLAGTVTLAVLLGFPQLPSNFYFPLFSFVSFLSAVVVAQLLYFFHLQSSIPHVFTKEVFKTVI